MPKVLVTGASGFLATNVMKELLKRGYSVRAMTRSVSDVQINNKRLETYSGNITDENDVIRAAAGCNFIIHSAAVTDPGLPGYRDYEPVNVGGSRNIALAAEKNGTRRIVYVSSANTLGYGTKKDPGTETMPVRFPFTQSHYAVSKAAAQKLMLETCRRAGTEIIVVNPAFMIGPDDIRPGSNKIILRACGKKILFIPPGGKNFIHVRDAATAVCNAVEKGRSGECYLLANENLTYREFYRKMEAVSGIRYIIITIPEAALLLAGFAGSIAAAAGVKTAVTATNMRIISTCNYYSGGKALRELDMPQTPVNQAISDAIAWFREKKGICTGKKPS